jgi:hypothetical protein
VGFRIGHLAGGFDLAGALTLDSWSSHQAKSMTDRYLSSPAMAQLTDDEWFRLIVRSLNELRIEDFDFPGVP